VLGYGRSLGSNKYYESRLGWSRLDEVETDFNTINQGNLAERLGIPGANAGNVAGLTTSTISGQVGLGDSYGNLVKIDNNWEVDQALSWIKGNHEIKFGFDWEKFQTRAAAYNSGNFAYGYYNPAEEGLLPASMFTKVSSCSILHQFQNGGCGNLVPYFYTYSLPSAIANTQGGFPGDPNFPAYTFKQASSPTNDDHIKEVTPAPYLQLDFGTDFNGMPFKAVAGIRYEKTNVTANSLQKVPTAVVWVNPTEFSTTYAANDDCTLTYSFMGMALPSGQSGISAGSIFAHIDCPNAVNMGGSVSGVQVTTEDGGFSNAMCEGTADFFFQNCSQ